MATILIVEDDPDLRYLYEATLSRHGHTVLTAPEVVGALLQLTNRAIDVIVLDIAIPILPGTRVLEFVRDDPRLRALPVIVVSGDGRARDRVMALGAARFLMKPVTMETLARLIDELVESSPSGDQP